MAKILKTDYASTHHKHRIHVSKKNQRKHHKRRRDLKIMLTERKHDEYKKEYKYKKFNQVIIEESSASKKKYAQGK